MTKSYDNLNHSLGRLASVIENSKLPLWVPLTESEKSSEVLPRDKAIQLFCDIWYLDGQDGRVTRSCHGLIAADEQMLEACAKANKAKMEFRSAIDAIRGNPDEKQWLLGLSQRDSQLKQDLNTKGIGRLHLKQCYRLIPTLDQHPTRVGFNWYNSGRSIKKVTVIEVQKQLTKMGLDKPHIALQYDQLKHLPSQTPLAKVQQQAPLMRANIRFDSEDQCSDRQAMNLSLPLVFAWKSKQPFPDHNEPLLQPPEERQRKVRSDRIIEDTPFLPSLRIHRYSKN
ncbi:hypothetical protein BGP75_26040 [Motiliproteus sp. MSK22-1]|nr:hypothetical protein BGP75_26040 [Motiliproteus sp. MSK22-1]